MFCQNCGAQLNNKARFCHVCGTPVSETSPSQSQNDNTKYAPVIYALVFIFLDLQSKCNKLGMTHRILL